MVKVVAKKKDILGKIFAIDKSLGIRTIDSRYCITENHLVMLYEDGNMNSFLELI